MLEPVKVGLLGLGTVGGGTVNVLARNGGEIARRAGREIRVVQACVRDPSKVRICATDGIELVTDPVKVVENPAIDVVAELIGGTTPALDLTLRAIRAGKHVVTANKALIALHGNEIFAAAQAAGVIVAFEAAVAGGIPLIKTVREGLAGNRIEWLAGIVNGTSNFILTEMRDNHRDYAEVLADAQTLGYAEADPTFDVEGVDAAHKLTILAAIAFGIPLNFDSVYTEGISGVTAEDIRYADQLGYRIKHLAIARRSRHGVELRVHPAFVPVRQLLASVNGVMNAVLIMGDAVGPTLYYGAGAGAEPTASSVVADLVEVVRSLTADPNQRVPHLAFQPDSLDDIPVLDMDDVHTAYFLRMQAEDRPGVLADVARILGDAGISIEAVVQPEPPPGVEQVPLIMLTHRVREAQMNEALRKIAGLASIGREVTRIRVEHLDGA